MTYKRLHVQFLLLIVGCQPSQINLPEREPVTESSPLASAFDAASTAKIVGRINFVWPDNPPPHWVFNIPDIPPIRRPIDNVKFEEIRNPNHPNYSDNGLVGAVVMLHGIDPARSKPWQHALHDVELTPRNEYVVRSTPFQHGPVVVELTERGIFVTQNGQTRRDGIVRKGDKVIIRNTSDKPLGIRGHGAEFFSHILAPSRPAIERRFEQIGRVELTSASGQFWASADLFIVDTPYCTRTGSRGEYEFDDVPAGECEFHIYLPNWNVDAKEIDPESSLVVRQRYGPPFEERRKLTLRPGDNVGMDRTLNATPLMLNP